MILLNEPWSHYDRRHQTERRRESAIRLLICFFYCAGCLAVGFAIGVLISGH